MQIASAFAVLGKEGPGGAARPAEPPSADAAA
jgi:hypothetical protein